MEEEAAPTQIEDTVEEPQAVDMTEIEIMADGGMKALAKKAMVC